METKLILSAVVVLSSVSGIAQFKVASVVASYTTQNVWPTGYLKGGGKSTRAQFTLLPLYSQIGTQNLVTISYTASAVAGQGYSLTYNSVVDSDPILLTYTVEYTGVGVPPSGIVPLEIERNFKGSRYVFFSITQPGSSGDANYNTWLPAGSGLQQYPQLLPLAGVSAANTLVELEDFQPGSVATNWLTSLFDRTGTTTGFTLGSDGKYRAIFTINACQNTSSLEMDSGSTLNVSSAMAGGTTVSVGVNAQYRFRLKSFAGLFPNL
jgi:hypothetical protein